MKTIMRLQKTQVNPVKEYTTPGVVEFKPDLYIMAGYKEYDATIIGACGGRAGYAQTDAKKDGDKAVSYGGGGGGGGLLRLHSTLISLKDLGVAINVAVGAAGATGANGGADAKAGDGGDGGQSSLYAWVAYGGEGGIGGDYNSTVYSPPTVNTDLIDVTTRPRGGNGGGNSAGLGAGGVGGLGAMYEMPASGVPNDTASVAPTTGTYVAGGVAPVIGGGKGGGGGNGRVTDFGTGQSSPRAGTAGSSGSPLSGAGGPAATNEGGYGGGAELLDASDNFFGGGIGNRNGAVRLVFS